MPASTPIFKLSSNAPDTIPTSVGPPEHPTSPPNASRANNAVPPFGRAADALLNVPGHMMPTDNPQTIMIRRIQNTFIRSRSFTFIPDSSSSISGAIGTFVKTNTFPIGVSAQMSAKIFQFPIPKIKKNRVEISTTPACPQQ